MRAEANTSLAEARPKQSGEVRIGLLGGFTVTVGDRKVDESAWRLRESREPHKVARPSSWSSHSPRAGDGPPLAEARDTRPPPTTCARPSTSPAENSIRTLRSIRAT